jgi:hypothetical protein
MKGILTNSEEHKAKLANELMLNSGFPSMIEAIYLIEDSHHVGLPALASAEHSKR